MCLFATQGKSSTKKSRIFIRSNKDNSFNNRSSNEILIGFNSAEESNGSHTKEEQEEGSGGN